MNPGGYKHVVHRSGLKAQTSTAARTFAVAPSTAPGNPSPTMLEINKAQVRKRKLCQCWPKLRDLAQHFD